ncbi:MAG: co-chaperone GroES [Deltaproteobacteria bacterium]|nr:co-chaperone GroES [Deltaproteobacteria bacterium]
MAIRPLHDRILVRRVKEEDTTKGGIIIPDTAKKGDLVLFGKYGGTEVKIDGEDHLILREDDILGIIE